MEFRKIRLSFYLILIYLIIGGVVLFFKITTPISISTFFLFNSTQELQLKSSPRILCAVMTIPVNHKTKARAVRDTWSKRCDKVLYFTSAQDPLFPNNSVVILNVSEGRPFLWHKTREAFLYIEENYGDEFDWFLKADDDTYFIIENLRAFLSDQNPLDLVAFGSKLIEPGSKYKYLTGGAGYVLSRGAIKAFAEAVHNETLEPSRKNSFSRISGCGPDHSPVGEDVRFGLCLEGAGVTLIDSHGSNDTFRFLQTMLEHFVSPDRNSGNEWMVSYGSKLGQGIEDCCDHKLISIHYTTPKMMYVYEFMIYHFNLERSGPSVKL